MRQHVRAPRSHALAIAVAISLTSAAAFAQDAPAAAAETAPAAESEAKTLDALMVTAQRRVERAKDVPMALTTVDAEKLHVLGSGGGDIRYLSGRLPSLNIESSFGRAFPRFYIRGLGNTDFDLNASQPVSLVYDDIVLENPLLKGFPVFDMENVELLRGPQGTLFGRNTPAGVVKFESAKPTRELEGYGQIAYGTHGTTNIEGAISGPLGPNWSARASVLYQRRDEWVTNTNPNARTNPKLEGYDESAARLQLQYDGSETFHALFNVHARHLNGTARLFRANIFKPGTNDLVDGFDDEKIAIDGRNFQQLDTFGASARLSWDFGNDLTLYSITGYESADSLSRGDIDGGVGAVFAPPSGPGVIPFTAESADGLPDHRQWTQEFRLESNYSGPLNWQAGLFYFDEDITVDSFNYDTLGGGVQAGWAQQKQRNKAWAAYGSLDYAVTDKLTLRGGLRYTQDKKDFTASVLQSAPFGAPVSGPFPVHTDVDDVSWDASAVYQVTPDVNLYARVAKGFRAPSIQGRLLFQVPPQPSVADAEKVISYEAGVKADLWDKRARLGFAVFHYNVDNQQLNAVGGARNQTVLLNADKTVGQGFELDFDAYVTDNLMITLGASYNDTEIKDANLAVAPCGSGMCTVTDPPVIDPITGAVLARIDGNPLPQAPKWVYNLTARYSLPVGDGGEFFVYTDWAYRSEVNFFLYEAKEFRGKALLEGGLRVGYGWDDGKYELALYGRNILDKVQAVGAIDFNNLTGFVNEPRIVGLEFKAGF
ncbi:MULTISPECIES: TonB-dependent receptor [unclassified Lysobacter]|uniref:TonB-dependent receptor n=1 Tax=unclassified Lysobacter TaxID=2635362 RepID=UPI0006F4AF95|nr:MULTISPECIES: TonB-dependent receptor [unclassified Lysobacter]KQZ57571.1 TonB-dependent receptor [Lysobacter sp. Root559]KRC33719.1 TonB-dependent receptor [Lysobacter sp. Root76]KRD69056.1 TonB-dependent receptor [Lysobacter sp. Root96]